jgi:APA family basic amino acid/polyamine antiporter
VPDSHPVSAAGDRPGLERALGRWDLTAIGVNQVIGSAIFLMPSQVAAAIGGWSPLAFVLAGLASLLVALSFAEVASRFDATGGAYLYTRAAFGRFVAFEVGWMQWFTRVTSHASVANGLVMAVGFYAPALTTGPGRAGLLAALLLALGWINALGIRQSALVVNTLTVGKLLPLALFILVGLASADLGALPPLQPVTLEQVSRAGLLLIFVFGGFDVVPVPAGEANDPRRHMPFALTATILIVTAVMTLAQIVAMAVLPDLPASTTPLADASFVLMGALGALLVGVGSIVSMAGNNAGQVLSGSRMLYAIAENGDLPRVFAAVHPRHHTPHVAIWTTTAVALILALTGSFVALAAASAVARLVTYTGTCAACLRLRHPRFDGVVGPATFMTPGGRSIPRLAILVSLLILVGASREQLVGGAAALAAGAALYALRNVGAARRARSA